MNDIDALVGRLSLDLDQRLTPPDKALLEEDLARLPQHQPLVMAMRDMDRLFRQEPMLAPRRDLMFDILTHIDHSQRRRDQGVVGMTFVLGGFLSLAPLMLLSVLVICLAFTILQPGLAASVIGTLVGFFGRLYGLTILAGAVQTALGGWVIPLIAATSSLVLLTLAVVWAQRLQTAAPAPIAGH